MQEVVGVVFRRLGKLYHFDPNGLRLLPGDQVIVKTQKGIEMGEVEEAPFSLEEEHIAQPLKKVLRRANEEDLAKLEENSEKEAEAFKYGKEKIAEVGLKMQLFQVEQSFDENKMTFYFTAENRVDFRNLVKDLAAHLKTRIELRQIGVRDKAKMVGGFGHCGQNLCCSMWLDNLNPISIRMAKEQNLSLNPVKISGVCGRLMCCLQYEHEAYKDFNKRAPGKGKCVETCSGHSGCVISQNPVRERLKIRSENGMVTEVPLSDVTKVTNRPPPRKDSGGERPDERQGGRRSEGGRKKPPAAGGGDRKKGTQSKGGGQGKNNNQGKGSSYGGSNDQSKGRNRRRRGPNKSDKPASSDKGSASP